MKILVAGNNKGGVGKTFFSSTIGEYTAKYLKKPTLLIGYDPQCNIDNRYLDMEVDPYHNECFLPPIHPDFNPEEDDGDGRSSIADIFYDKNPSIWPYPTFIDNLDILPASGDKLLKAEAVREDEVVESVYDRLKMLLTSKALRETYELVIIDTGPSKGPLTISAIKIATHLLIPSQMEDKSIQGTYGLASVWMQESTRKQREWPLTLIGIVANQFDNRTTLHNDLFSQLQNNPEMGKYVIPHKISKRIVYAETDCKGANPRSVFDLPDKDGAKQECLKVCEYITKRIFDDE